MAFFGRYHGGFRRLGSAPSNAADAQGTPTLSPAATLETLSDEDLVRQLLAGYHDALTVLFERYSGMVFKIARRMLKDEGEAEETVQQVFFDVYRALDQFDASKASYKTWLLNYAYHRAINRKHHLEAKGFYTLEELRDDLLPSEYQAPVRTVHLSSPEVVHLIEQLLAGIQPRQRTTIELTYFEGLTAEEIALRTGESPTVVRHNLYRGLSKIRSVLLQPEHQSKKDKARNEAEGLFFAEPRSL
jgi:RNA polymerase sigma-70 factor (ECF subfamily)